MNIFRKLRWKLTLSYTLVTVFAFLAIVLILGGVFLSGVLLPENELDPELMITDWYNGSDQSIYPILSQLLSQTPVDTVLINLFMQNAQATFTNVPLYQFGSLQFWVSTTASIRVLILGPDGVLLGFSPTDDPNFRSQIGLPFNPSQIPGLEGPFRAALAGETNPKDLYTILVPNQKMVMAGPIFKSGEGKDRPVAGVIVILFDAIPTQNDIPVYILRIAGMSLVIFLLAVGIIGTIFGSIFAHGLADRFRRISTTTDRWSSGDFSQYIDDPTGDEITSFSQRLNQMAQQLQSLLRRRQEMAISEERNRLARDLHDSAKQQALAASFELGTALTLYEREPKKAKQHLQAADALVDSVRKELTTLVDELRPLPSDGHHLADLLTEYAANWSQRNGIALDMHIEDLNRFLRRIAKRFSVFCRRLSPMLPGTAPPALRKSW